MAQILITPVIIIFLNIALLILNQQVAVPISAIFHSSATTNDNTSVVSRAEWYALLDLKARIKITNTSDVLLRSWNANNSLKVCKWWTGVKCTRSGRHIASINLAGFGLIGSLSPHLGNLTFISTLNLSSNLFFGGIPPQLSACSSLQILDLYNNSLTGPIPPSLGYLSSLQVLRLCINSLSGPIPLPLFTNCTSLIILNLCSNSLMGSIPASDNYGWHLPRLQSLVLSDNHLTGSIPRNLGNCSNLEYLYLRNNTLSGKIPIELGSLTNLKYLHLYENSLMSGIPRRMGNCTGLLDLNLSENQLSGPIPKELSQAYLLELNLWNNKLTGPIPSALANCTQLKLLSLSTNQLIGFIPNELIKLKHLQMLDLSDNRLEGPLINMTSLLTIDLRSNLFSGPIPGKLVQGLQFLDLSHNQFSGLIPWESLCNITSLNQLSMAHNNLTGSFTGLQLSRLINLQKLYLDHNFLQGSIPDFEASIGSLLIVDLSFNQLNGTLRSANLGNVLKNVISLNFSNNGFSGVLPPWLGELMKVQEMHLSHNHFFGGIPESLGDCKELLYLDLSENNLVGEIPSQLGAMLSLTELDLSSNHLTGMLPSTLAQSQFLQFLNVSFNDLKGPIPVLGVFKRLDARSFQGNPGLCGQLVHTPCNNIHHHAQLAHWKRSILIVSASLVITTTLIACFIIHIYRYSMHQQNNVTQSFEIPGKKLRRFSIVELLESTNSYSNRNLLGEGAHSEVYKGVLPSGEMFAVKKFRDFQCVREALLQEVHIMNKIRHRNLVKILGYALDSEVHAIVLEFMPHGSVEKYLQECKKSHTLSLTMIVKIAQGVANALAYLHHEYDVASIIHGDIKPSNILLNSEFEACLADFGLAKHTKGDMGTMTLSSNIKGSLGYMAPEFAYAAKITPKVDLYSFGVVVLEMLTMMEPTHELLHGVTLHEWVKQKFLLEDGVKLKEIVHPSLLLGSSSNNFDESRVRVLLQMAIACTEVLPNKRPTMYDIKKFLDSLPVL